MCIRLNPTAHKNCSKPESCWLRVFRRSGKTLRNQETMALPKLVNKKFNNRFTGSMSTDDEKRVSVVRAVTRRTEHLIMKYGKQALPLKQTKSKILLSIGGYNS